MAGNRGKGKARGDGPGEKKSGRVNPSSQAGVPEGRRLRDAGCHRAVRNNPVSSLQLKIDLAEWVRKNGKGTIDDVTPEELITGKFNRRGPWRGGAASSLVQSKTLKVAGFEPSRRPARKGGWNKVYVARDAGVLTAKIQSMRAELAALLQAGVQA